MNLLILYRETKALDNRAFKVGPFLAAGAGVLVTLLINGIKVLFMTIGIMLSLQKLTDVSGKMIFHTEKNKAQI